MEIEDAVNNNNWLEVPQECTGHEHFSLHVLDEVFQINVDEMFTFLFTDSPIFKEFISLRQTYDVNLAPWQETPDENGIKTRCISYTLSINYSIGPKCSPSNEMQKLYPESKPGLKYFVDADCYNRGVPYADDFYTTVRYCMMRVSDERCKLNVTGHVTYKKHMWGVIKAFIEKTASSGLIGSFGVMAGLLRRESNRRLNRSESPIEVDRHRTRPSSGRKSKSHAKERHQMRIKRQNAVSNSSYSEMLTVHKMKASFVSRHDETFASFTDLLAKSVFIVVVALVIINMVLFCQISSLETTVAKAISKYKMH